NASTESSAFLRYPAKSTSAVKYHISKLQSITAEAADSFTNPQRLRNAWHENPVHACGHAPAHIYTSWATTTNHHEALSTRAPPAIPHPSLSIRSQLSATWMTSAAAEIQAMAIILLWACRNFEMGKFRADHPPRKLGRGPRDVFVLAQYQQNGLCENVDEGEEEAGGEEDDPRSLHINAQHLHLPSAVRLPA
ncbi:Nodal homolog 4-A, partial [Striga asiatica]